MTEYAVNLVCGRLNGLAVRSILDSAGIPILSRIIVLLHEVIASKSTIVGIIGYLHTARGDAKVGCGEVARTFSALARHRRAGIFVFRGLSTLLIPCRSYNKEELTILGVFEVLRDYAVPFGRETLILFPPPALVLGFLGVLKSSSSSSDASEPGPLSYYNGRRDQMSLLMTLVPNPLTDGVSLLRSWATQRGSVACARTNKNKLTERRRP